MNLTDQIDQILPQTQCGLCGYQGCRPYANAIAADNAPLNLCPPGGLDTLRQLGQLMKQDIGKFENEMKLNSKPSVRAVILEEECIGCTKCIQACPLDAIVGGAKQMHTIIAQDCSGCELCIAPCPVDCIELKPIPAPTAADKINRREHFRRLYHNHQTRHDRIATEKALKHQQAKQGDPESLNLSVDARKAAIAAALLRVREKKNGC